MVTGGILGYAKNSEPVKVHSVEISPRRIKICTPWKINMELTNHPFRKEMIFQTSMIMFHVNLPGCLDVGVQGKFLNRACSVDSSH